MDSAGIEPAVSALRRRRLTTRLRALLNSPIYWLFSFGQASFSFDEADAHIDKPFDASVCPFGHPRKRVVR